MSLGATSRRRLLAGLAAALVLPRVRAAPVLRWSAEPTPWAAIFRHLPPALRRLLDEPRHQIQIVHTTVQRDADGAPRLAHHGYRADAARWFAAASLIKLPVAVLALERAAAHAADGAARIVLDVPPAAGEWPPGEPLDQPLARSLERVFVVSDNAEYNRHYEFLGPDAIHQRLAALGYVDTRAIARIGDFNPASNRAVGGSRLLAADGTVLERHPPRRSAIARRAPQGQVLRGQGWMDGTRLVREPHDFSYRNFLPLAEAHRMVAALLYPQAFAPAQRFALTPSLRTLLLGAMGRLPRQSRDPLFDPREFPDGWAKFLVLGDTTGPAPAWLRHVGKSGMAYGYLSESAWLADADAGVECFLSAVVHVNADGIYNDDRYEYEGVGLPFLGALGRAALAAARDARRG